MEAEGLYPSVSTMEAEGLYPSVSKKWVRRKILTPRPAKIRPTAICCLGFSYDRA